MFGTAAYHFRIGSSHKSVILLKEKNQIQQLKKDNDVQNRALEADKDRLLKMLREHEEEKRAWEAEKAHLLKVQKEFETKLRPGKNRSDPLKYK